MEGRKNGKTSETSAVELFILPGVGRAHLLSACRVLGIPSEERPFTMDELRDADEIIVSSAGILCARVTELDGLPVGGKDATTFGKLQDYLFDDWFEKTEK